AVLFVISPKGDIVSQVTIQNSSPHMLGLEFNPVTRALWVLDFGAGKVLNVNPTTGASSVLAGPIPDSGLNAEWSSDPLLGPGTGLTPAFGANGVEFNNDRSILFVANTAFHQIIQIPVNSNGSAGTASIFVTGINAPDGIRIDRDDNIWICTNQEDEIVVIDNTGKVIAKLGDFGGIDENGIVRGFLFPASLAFSKDRSTLYVSNLTLYLPYAGAQPAIDSAWTLQVKGYTVSQLPAKI